MSSQPVRGSAFAPGRPQGLPPGWGWRDLRFLWILAWPLASLDALWRDPGVLAWRTLALYVVVMVVDACVPKADRSPGPVVRTSAYFSVVLQLYVPLQFAVQLSAAWVAWHTDGLTMLGIAFAVGVMSGVLGVTVAHELGHSPRRVNRMLAWLLMTSVAYPHFMVEHYRGHHPRAATWADPATARRGESLWRFLRRTLSGSFVHAWKLEARRLYQCQCHWGQSSLVWAFSALALGVLAAAIALAFQVLAFGLLQAAIAVFLLETVNYIEHYGLQRQQHGVRLEPFNHMHAWNADHVMSNTMLINLQRHSDHHVNPWKPYATLVWMADSPQLPNGYAGSVVLAMIPPLWFAVMNPRLEQTRNKLGWGDVPTLPSALGNSR